MTGPGPRFWWGVATSAFQIEGTDGDVMPSVWSEFTRRPGAIADGSDATLATDHVRRLDEDVALLSGLGVDAYRFSISWPRVLAEGLGFYDWLVDRLLAAGITPLPTLFHWDTPLALEREHGGWLGRVTAERFAEHAAAMAEGLADRVEHWITINEPREVTLLGHALGVHAPGRSLMFDALPVAHHLLLGHGLAAEALRAAGVGSVGIAMSHEPVHVVGESGDDGAAADLYDVLNNRLFADPVLLGEYPAGFADLMPGPVADDLEVIGGSVDWYGINYYSPAYVGAPGGPGDSTGAGGDVNGIAMPDGLPFTVHDVPPGYAGERTDFGWVVAPEGLAELLVGLRERYDDGLPPLVITENGCSVGEIDDQRRIGYLRDHLDALETARAAGIDVRGYFHWTLTDNFEWAEGYRQRFGLVHVDRDTLERTPRSSYHWYAERIRSGT